MASNRISLVSQVAIRLLPNRPKCKIVSGQKILRIPAERSAASPRPSRFRFDHWKEIHLPTTAVIRLPSKVAWLQNPLARSHASICLDLLFAGQEVASVFRSYQSPSPFVIWRILWRLEFDALRQVIGVLLPVFSRPIGILAYTH